MKFKKTFALFSLALIVGVMTADAKTKKVDPDKVGIEFRYWSPDISTSARFSRNAIGDELDLKKDASVDEEEISEFTLSYKSGAKSELRASYFAREFKGNVAFSRDIGFKGTTYNVGTSVQTHLEMDYSKFQWRWYSEESPEPLRFGVILDMKVINFDVSLKPAAGILSQEEEKVFFWMPGVGGIVEYQVLPNGIVFGEGSGMSLDVFGYKPSGYLYDFEYGYRHLICEGFDVSVGYRMLEFKSSDSPDNFELGLDGYFFGARVKF